MPDDLAIRRADEDGEWALYHLWWRDGEPRIDWHHAATLEECYNYARATDPSVRIIICDGLDAAS